MQPTDSVDPNDRSGGTPTIAGPSRLFVAWQRLVGSVLGLFGRTVTWSGRVARAWIAQWPRVYAYHTTAQQRWLPEDAEVRETAASVGARSFIFGIAVAALVTAAAKGIWLPGVVTLMSELLWAGTRFIIIALLMPPGTMDRRRLSIAFLAGLLPYGFGATALLRGLALLLSALMTYRGLLGAGAPLRDTRTLVGWSFGGQAGIIAGGLLVRVIIAVVASG